MTKLCPFSVFLFFNPKYLTSFFFCAIPFVVTTSIKPLIKIHRGRARGVRDRNKRVMNPNSLANLRPGNPPVDIPQNNGYSLTAELKHALNKEKRLAIVNSIIEGAILREPAPFHELWDRVEGKVPGDQPPANQDNRVVNIYVTSDKAKELMSRVAERLLPPVETS